jgi:hypothetical protein
MPMRGNRLPAVVPIASVSVLAVSVAGVLAHDRGREPHGPPRPGSFVVTGDVQEVLLATSQDGASLVDQGPRLVVPGDRAGGRYVTGVAQVRIDKPRR